MYMITKEFRFEAAHRLTKGYKGKCANIHGHSWIIKVQLEGEKLDEHDMLTDFGSLKKFRDWIDEKLDHSIIVCKEDEEMIKFCREHNQRHFVMTSNPTSEKIAVLCLSQLKLMDFEGARQVTVNETCTCAATFRG